MGFWSFLPWVKEREKLEKEKQQQAEARQESLEEIAVLLEGRGYERQVFLENPEVRNYKLGYSAIDQLMILKRENLPYSLEIVVDEGELSITRNTFCLGYFSDEKRKKEQRDFKAARAQVAQELPGCFEIMIKDDHWSHYLEKRSYLNSDKVLKALGNPEGMEIHFKDDGIYRPHYILHLYFPMPNDRELFEKQGWIPRINELWKQDHDAWIEERERHVKQEVERERKAWEEKWAEWKYEEASQGPRWREWKDWKDRGEPIETRSRYETYTDVAYGYDGPIFSRVVTYNYTPSGPPSLEFNQASFEEQFRECFSEHRSSEPEINLSVKYGEPTPGMVDKELEKRGIKYPSSDRVYAVIVPKEAL